jgi:hypothetical protein
MLDADLQKALDQRTRTIMHGGRSEVAIWAVKVIDVITRDTAPSYFFHGSKSGYFRWVVPYLPTSFVDYMFSWLFGCDKLQVSGHLA